MAAMIPAPVLTRDRRRQRNGGKKHAPMESEEGEP